uniref:Uncharacterized protein LOC114337131 n=1 Tax=Diabrotica virgifera virgifera TaxID=50390 RepID=A0A6P7G2Z0_DIAVI
MTPLSFLSVLLVFLPFVYLQEYRLPKTVVPSHYALSFTFNRQVFAGTIFEFSGSTVITIKTSESVANIQLHADPSFLRIGAISLDQGGEIDSYNVDAVTQILTITTKADKFSEQKKNGLLGLLQKKTIPGYHLGFYENL